MSENAKQQAQSALINFGTLLPKLEVIYRDIHSHPELSIRNNSGQQALPRMVPGGW